MFFTFILERNFTSRIAVRFGMKVTTMKDGLNEQKERGWIVLLVQKDFYFEMKLFRPRRGKIL